MKTTCLTLLALCSLLAAPRLAAQAVSAELVYDQEQYLASEPIIVGVRVRNFSGRTIHFGAEPDWIKFSIQGNNNFVVRKLGETPVAGEFDLESANTATKRVDIAPYFELTKPGRYSITATVRVPALGKDITTKPRYLEIISGAKIWEQEFGVPNSGTTPEIRKYSIVQTSSGNTPKLYVRVSDQNESRMMLAFSLGGTLTFSRPELQIDKQSRLHVLNQYSGKSFNYCIVSPNAELLLHYTYEYTTSRPTLTQDKEGNIVVSGGARRITSADLPPPPPAEKKQDEPAKP